MLAPLINILGPVLFENGKSQRREEIAHRGHQRVKIYALHAEQRQITHDGEIGRQRDQQSTRP